MTDNRRLFLFGLMLFLAVIAAYSNHFDNGFHFDDAHTIVNNIYIRDVANIPLFFKDGTTFSSLPANQSYRPVVSATLALDYRIGKGDVFYFHLSTFILFLLQGLLMFMFYIKTFKVQRDSGNAGIVALLSVSWYMLHPASAETVNYIIARSDTLSTLFVIASFVMFIYSDFSRKWYLYLVPVALGMLAKPSAFVFAPLLFIYELLFEKDVSLSGIVRKKPAAKIMSAVKETAPAFLLCFALLLFIRKMDPPTWTPGGTTLFGYLITQPFVTLHYFISFFFPVSLSADTDWTVLPGIMDVRFFLGLLFIAGLICVAIITSGDEKKRPISFGILWFLISLLPTSLVPLAEVMNDHRVFLPFVGLAMGAGCAVNIAVEKIRPSFRSVKIFNRSIAMAILIVLSIYAYGTYERNKVWKTDESLWRDVTEKSPKNGRGLMNYGLALMARGDYRGAETYFIRALGLNPKYAYLHINLGILKDATGAPAEAEHYFRNAIAIGPNYPECFFYYARFLKAHGRSDEAIGNLKRALELAPGHMDARYLLMSIYFESGDPEDLRALAEDTLRIFPNDVKAAQYISALKGEKSQQSNATITPESLLNLSLTYYQRRQFDKSIEAASEALKLKPDYALAYNNICAAYNELKQWDNAIEAGEKAVKLDPNNQLAKNNLSWARKQKLSEKLAPSESR